MSRISPARRARWFLHLQRCRLRSKAGVATRRRAKLWVVSTRSPTRWFALKTIRWATWSRRTRADAARILVQVAGGPGMTLSEVEIVMKELGRHVNDETQILFGTAVDGRLGDRLSVTIISSFTADEPLPQPQPSLSSMAPMPP